MPSKKEIMFRVIDLEDLSIDLEEDIADLKLRLKVLEDALIKPKKTTKKTTRKK